MLRLIFFIIIRWFLIIRNINLIELPPAQRLHFFERFLPVSLVEASPSEGLPIYTTLARGYFSFYRMKFPRPSPQNLKPFNISSLWRNFTFSPLKTSVFDVNVVLSGSLEVLYCIFILTSHILVRHVKANSPRRNKKTLCLFANSTEKP